MANTKENEVKKADIVIMISGGAVQYVEKPKGIALEIRDYDIEESDEPENRPDCFKDEKGDWYQKMFWGNDETADSNNIE